MRATLTDAGLLPHPPRRDIMAMPIPLPKYTVEMVRAFPDDGQRYELVEGMLLVTPAPAFAHQVVIAKILTVLNSHLGTRGPAIAVSPGEIEIAPSLHLEPDILVVPRAFKPGSKWTEISGWWLAVEVLSPSSKYYDRDYKLGAYLGVGVPEIWIVDLERRRVETSKNDGARSVTTASLRWQPHGMVEPLTLELDEIFAGC
jgi:Uma2 family endonuclease